MVISENRGIETISLGWKLRVQGLYSSTGNHISLRNKSLEFKNNDGLLDGKLINVL